MYVVNFPPVEGRAGSENLTLTQRELESCGCIAQAGQILRAFCPFHGSDNQRSLWVSIETGRFKCFACGCWGYMDWSRRKWRIDGQKSTRRGDPHKNRPLPGYNNLPEVLRNYQIALDGSLGAEYIRSRGISLALAREYGLGYASSGKWIHTARDWKCGRVVFPHTDPDGRLLNLYGRAVGTDESVLKEIRHDHLPGGKGYFNAVAVRGSGAVCITEGPFDALSLIAAGLDQVTAIFGADAWRWDWAGMVPSLILALDADATGQKKWREIAGSARLRGRTVAFLPPEAYAGHKDANEAWMAGALNLAA